MTSANLNLLNSKESVTLGRKDENRDSRIGRDFKGLVQYLVQAKSSVVPVVHHHPKFLKVPPGHIGHNPFLLTCPLALIYQLTIVSKVFVSLVTGKFDNVFRFKICNQPFGLINRINVRCCFQLFLSALYFSLRYSESIAMSSILTAKKLIYPPNFPSKHRQVSGRRKQLMIFFRQLASCQGGVGD